LKGLDEIVGSTVGIARQIWALREIKPLARTAGEGGTIAKRWEGEGPSGGTTSPAVGFAWAPSPAVRERKNYARHQARIPFWTCSRFSASSRRPIAAVDDPAVTSSPRLAGRHA